MLFNCFEILITSTLNFQDAKPFACDLCSYTGKEKSKLEQHLRSTHKLELKTKNALWSKMMKEGKGYQDFLEHLRERKGAKEFSPVHSVSFNKCASAEDSVDNEYSKGTKFLPMNENNKVTEVSLQQNSNHYIQNSNSLMIL